jgi:hypothetical protein
MFRLQHHEQIYDTYIDIYLKLMFVSAVVQSLQQYEGARKSKTTGISSRITKVDKFKRRMKRLDRVSSL